MAHSQTVLVTGASGFLGRHVVAALRAAGYPSLRALCRRPAPDLEKQGVEVVLGSVVEPAACLRAMAGARRVVHLAGVVARAPADATELFDTHVVGTRNVLNAARDAALERVVHVSTSGTICCTTDPDRILDESAPFATDVVRRWPYYLSKIYAEEVAQDFARAGLPVVVCSPSLLLGPGDEALSSTADICRFLRREVPAIPPGGFSFVDCRDAAPAIVEALARGRAGERYLLGGPNVTCRAFAELLEKVSGVPRPALAIPASIAPVAARALYGLERAVGLDADEAAALDYGAHHWYVDSRKAQAELSFSPRPAEETLRDTIDWLRAHDRLRAPTGLASLAAGTLNRLFS